MEESEAEEAKIWEAEMEEAEVEKSATKRSPKAQTRNPFDFVASAPYSGDVFRTRPLESLALNQDPILIPVGKQVRGQRDQLQLDRLRGRIRVDQPPGPGDRLAQIDPNARREI